MCYGWLVWCGVDVCVGLVCCGWFLVMYSWSGYLVLDVCFWFICFMYCRRWCVCWVLVCLVWCVLLYCLVSGYIFEVCCWERLYCFFCVGLYCFMLGRLSGLVGNLVVDNCVSGWYRNFSYRWCWWILGLDFWFGWLVLWVRYCWVEIWLLC